MVELTSTTKLQKPVVALVDPDSSRGGMSADEVHTQLLEAESSYLKWFGSDAETLPRGDELYNHLFLREAIEWNRIGHFQDCTMRLIAERILDEPGSTYV